MQKTVIAAALVTALACAPTLATMARAQDWPTRPVIMVVPFAAGGTTDVIGRILSTRLSEVLHQPVIIENVGGAGGMTGATRVAKAAPDGYQFVLGNVGTHAQNQTLYKNPLYNAATDFVPVGLLVDQPTVLIVRKDLPVRNLPEFIAYSKANQAKMQYGSAGAGSATHLSCALLNAAIGINVTHVPYRGGGPAMQDLIAGRIDYICLNIGGAFPQIESKTVNAIALLTNIRSRILPNVPTVQEQGLKDFEADNWMAFFLPKGAPAAIVRKLNDAAVATLNTTAVETRLREIGVEQVAPERRSPEYLAKFVQSEIKKWAGPIKAAGISTD
jgi:tripartite-type tricarboxylate transporter receptor subunit TctC